MRYGRIRTRRRRGFTLVELLMVMMIIAILAALLMVGVQSAWVTVGRAKILTELSQIETAINSYKSDKGEFPAGCTGLIGDVNTYNPATRRTQLQMHLRKAFPRFLNVNAALGTTGINFRTVTNAGAAGGTTKTGLMTNLDPAEAWLFFVNGLPVWNSDLGLPVGFDGFNADPTDPLIPLPLTTASSQAGRSRTKLLFDVDPKRLKDVDNDGWPEYYPTPDKTAPYVYFVSGLYNTTATTAFAAYPDNVSFPGTGSGQHNNLVNTLGAAMPYASRNPQSLADAMAWVRPQGFQLIAAGVDGKFGNTDLTELRVFPNVTSYLVNPSKTRGSFEIDNLANFHGTVLGSGQ